jgi:hypothetical protein
MSIPHMNAAWETGYSVHTKLVLLCLADRADKKTELCWPGWDEIQYRTGLSRGGLHNALNTLEADRVISRKRRKRSTLYRVSLSRLIELKSSPHDLSESSLHELRSSPSEVPKLHPVNQESSPSEPEPSRSNNGSTIETPLFLEIKKFISEAYDVNNVPMTWDCSEDEALKKWLLLHPKLSSQRVRQMVIGRFQSQGIPLGERPRLWIPHLARYAEGGLDRFGRLKANSSATVGMWQGGPGGG